MEESVPQPPDVSTVSRSAQVRAWARQVYARSAGWGGALFARSKGWATALRSSMPARAAHLSSLQNMLKNPDERSRSFAGLTLILIVVLSGIMLTEDRPLPPRDYARTWTLVEPSLSESAYVRITIPDGVTLAEPERAVKFVPEIDGSFVASDDPQVILYKPDELVLGSFYSVVVTEGDIELRGDFKVVEDPRVLSILPSSEAETHENSKVSVVFNRPMVPLSTLTERDSFTVPVELDPPTEGTWVWKSTRLLQFVPTSALTESSNYTVSVREGLRSLDGVSVPAQEHHFITRTLKRTGTSNEMVLPTEPFRITFNMPVDLARTEQELQVTRGGTTVPVVVRYATKKKESNRFLGLALFGDSEEEDRTVLEVLQVEDAHGRSERWDINTEYKITIDKAYPQEGDIGIDTTFATQFRVPDVIKEVRATSPRSSHVSPRMFDPRGTLEVEFYEPVDLKETSLTLKGLKEVRYGTVCKTDDEGNTVYKSGSEECERVEDGKTLVLTVDHEVYGRDESVDLTFEKVVVEDGIVLNPTPLTVPIRTYPLASILSTTPAGGGTNGSLTELELCSTVPLREPEAGTYREHVRSDGYMVFAPSPWETSVRVDSSMLGYLKTSCAVDQFRTVLHYGLHPTRAYHLALSFVDEFDQSVQAELAFTTEAPTAHYARLSSLQPVYNVTIPGRTTLTYAAENLEEVTVRVCKLAAATFLRRIEGGVSEYTDQASMSDSCLESVTKVIDLPDTYFVNNYFSINIKDFVSDPRGQYMITLYHPTFSETEDGPRYLNTYLSVTTLAVGEKSVGWWDYGERADEPPSPRSVDPDAQDLYWVVRASTLDPIEGALITPYESDRAWGSAQQLTPRTTVTTGGDGVARAVSAPAVRGAVVTYGGESAVVSSWADTLEHGGTSGGESRTYLYTDRPIYRPGDTVHLKGIDRVGYDGAWEVVREVPAEVVVRDSTGKDIAKIEAPVSEYGTFDTSFTLPNDAALGTWYIEAFGNSGYFSVEEYAPAAFKLDLTTDKEEYTAGDTLDVTVDAQYYFGLAVGNATVEYDIVAQDYYFDRVHDEGWWSFGEGWYYCYSCGYGDTFVRRGSVTLDAEGKGHITLPLKFDELFRSNERTRSKIFSVRVRVQDESGRQVGGTASTIVHRGEYYLGVRSLPGYAPKGRPVTIEHKSVDQQGNPVGGKEITETISKVIWRSYKRQEVDGGYYWHSEEEKVQVSERELTTDRNGDARSEYTFGEEGQYEIAVSGVDTRDNPIRSTTRVYIYGDGHVEVEQMNNTTLNLHTDKTEYAPGETGTVIFESPFEKAKALITVERGDIRSYAIKEVKGSIATADFTVDPALIPNGFVSVTLLSTGPEVRHGTAPFSVATDERELTVRVTPSKERYLPGEQVELTVETTNAEGTGVPAEVSVAVVDLSVLALKGNPKKNPLLFFYGDMPLGITTRHNLRNILTERDVPTGTKGGGGGDPSDLAKKKRGDFRDTATWQARVITDASGVAHVTFTLPDNLTTWQIESLGVTTDLRLGVNYREIMTKKALMAIPKKPRFVLPGDTFEVGAQLFNDTNEAVTVEFGVSSPTLTLDTDTRTVRIAPHESELVYVEAEAPRTETTGAHMVTFSATYPGAADVVEQRIPIKRNLTFETFATMAATTDARATEYVYLPDYAVSGEGELTIRARATLAGMLVDGMSYMASYPYGCAEQIASRLASLSIATRMERAFGTSSLVNMPAILDDEGDTMTRAAAIDAGVKKIYALQSSSGGFGWYSAQYPDYFLTLEVLRALLSLQDAGVSIQEGVIERALAYIQSELATTRGRTEDREAIAGLALTLSYPGVPEKYRSLAQPYVARIARDPLALEQLSSTALGYLALATARGAYDSAVADTFFAALENRLSVDARGAYVKSSMTHGYRWFETPEKNNGLFLATVAARGGEHPLAPQVLSWLMARRGQNGDWQTTNATYAVLDGVLAYAVARKENTAQFTLTIAQDGTELENHAFAPATIFDTVTHTLPIDALPRRTLTRISFDKEGVGDTNGTLYYDMALRYALPIEYVAPRDEGITVERVLTTLDGGEERTRASVGEVLEGKLTITIPEEYTAVAVEDYIPAGFELVNTRLATELLPVSEEGVVREFEEYTEDIDPSEELPAFPDIMTEYRDDRVFAFADRVSPGVYELTYYVRALVPGTFTHLPATVSEMYTPEVFGRTAGGKFEVEE